MWRLRIAVLLALAVLVAGCTSGVRTVRSNEADFSAPPVLPSEFSIDELPDTFILDGDGHDVASILATSPTLRISTYLGSQAPGAVDVTYVLEPDGDVLRISEGDIFTGPSGYRTWNIGPNGYRQIADHLASTRMIGERVPNVDGAPAPAGSISADEHFLFEAHGLDLPPTSLTPDQLVVRQEFKDLLDRLRDMSWLTDTTITEAVPWVPSHLALSVRDEYNPRYYLSEDIEWPLDRSIEELASDPIDGDRAICLSGTEAATVWRVLLIDGINNARLPVVDGERVYEIGLRISYPTYAWFGERCPVVTELDTPG